MRCPGKGDRPKACRGDGLHFPAPLEYAAPVSKVKPERVERKSYPFYLVWLTALFPFDLGTFSNMLDDPEATPGHAFEWTAIMGVIVGLITPLYIILTPEFRQGLASSGILSTVGNSQFVTAMIIFMVVMAVATPIFSILGLALNGALLNFLAAMFGGRGSYQRTVYALGAFSAPYLLVYDVVPMLPVLRYVSPFLGLYSFFCSIRALMAAHDFSTWDAIKTMLAPTALIIILGCIGIVVLMLTSSSGLPAR